MSNTLKIFLIILIVAVFGGIAYLLLGESGASSTLSSPLQTSSGAPVSGVASSTQVQEIDADQIGQEFIAQLLNIRAIRLRDDVFSFPAFVSLQDFTIELLQQGNEGRQNPFAPFGVDGQTMNDEIMDEEMLFGAPEDSFEFSTFPAVETSPEPAQNEFISSS